MSNKILSKPSSAFLPRLLRFRDAPSYLGMDRNRFNQIVRPYLTQIRIGIQGIAFDRLELDNWADHYMQRNGRPGKSLLGDELWDEEKQQGSLTEEEFGTSINKSVGSVFAKAVEQVISQQQKRS